jgi:hypothetical protein
MAGAFGALDSISSQSSSACSTPRTYQSNGYDGLSDFDEDDFAAPGPSTTIASEVTRAPPVTPGPNAPISPRQLAPVSSSKSRPIPAGATMNTIETALSYLDCDSDAD